ncbi:MAG: pyridoxamine 5'-phosphate oxidase family protein [Bacillota bacterium]
MKGAATATIALIDDRGYPRASTISSIKTEGISRAWFSTGLRSGKVKCLKNNNRASLCYHDGSNNITLTGTIEILTDPLIKREMWLDWFINHFPGGIDDPNYCILRFTAERAVLWVDSIDREIELEELTVGGAGQ